MRATHSGRWLLIATLVLAGAACGDKKTRAPKKKPEPAPPDPIEQAVRAVVKDCKVTELGVVQACKGDAPQRLASLESGTGIVRSLMGHCRLMQDPDPRVRALAATQIGGLANFRVLKDEGSDELLQCLMRRLKERWGKGEEWEAERLARATAFLATARGKAADFRVLVDTSVPVSARRVAYECLWPNGGMQVFPAIQAAAKDKDPGMRRAAAMGFVYVGSLGGDEVGPVCGLLKGLLSDKEVEVAGLAADRLAALCPDQREAVLDETTTRLPRKALDPRFVAALEGMCTAKTVPTPAPMQKRAVALLQQIAVSKSDASVRTAALQSLNRLEPSTAKKLAKRLVRDKDEAVQKAATAIQ